MSKANDPWLLLKANLKQLRLPTMLAEFEKLSREAAAANEDYPQYLLRLTELELATRQSNALKNRIKQADFPVILVVAGAFSIFTTPLENMPVVDMGNVFINTVYYGASADDVEQLVTVEIEKALMSV